MPTDCTSPPKEATVLARSYASSTAFCSYLLSLACLGSGSGLGLGLGSGLGLVRLGSQLTSAGGDGDGKGGREATATGRALQLHLKADRRVPNGGGIE